MIYFTDPDKRVYYAFFNENFDRDLLKQYFEYYKKFFTDLVCYHNDEVLDLTESTGNNEGEGESQRRRR